MQTMLLKDVPFYSEKNNLLLLVFSACVATVKCRRALHHDVLFFFWPSGIMDCMLFIFENRVPLMRWGHQLCGTSCYYWWNTSIKSRLLFPYASYASGGLFFFLRYLCAYYFCFYSKYFVILHFKPKKCALYLCNANTIIINYIVYGIIVW